MKYHTRFIFAILGVLAGFAAGPARGETHPFKPTVGHRTYAVREPVLRVKPGDLVETETLYGASYEPAGGESPGQVGPFYIEGARPDDTLVVKILRHPVIGSSLGRLLTSQT